jgi:8-oxo-dGTP pyrophosphatase MutT (NUDIX family)
MGTVTETVIETVAIIYIKSRKLLLVRPRGAMAFYMPGGKPEPGEGEVAALRREIDEELGTAIEDLGSQPFGKYEAAAYGKPEGTRVRITCYLGGLRDSPLPQAEVDELHLFTYAEYCSMPEVAPAVVKIMEDLHARGLVA